jgi:hypothetical protein
MEYFVVVACQVQHVKSLTNSNNPPNANGHNPENIKSNEFTHIAIMQRACSLFLTVLRRVFYGPNLT